MPQMKDGAAVEANAEEAMQKGGLGNWHFKSATNQTPRYAQPGEEGEEGTFILELKVLADVGLVGFPNAGKSTLLSVVSAAKRRPGTCFYAPYPYMLSKE